MTVEQANVRTNDEPDITTVCMWVTPEMAKEWLHYNHEDNRVINQERVRLMAADIIHDRWHMTHQGIAFDEHGRLVDGQHRLTAIVRANRPVRMPVTTNLRRDAVVAIDGGRVRSAADQLSFEHGGRVCHTRVAVVVRVAQGHRAGKLQVSTAQIGSLLRLYAEPLEYAMGSIAWGRGISTAATRAVVAKAWYTVDRDRLSEFCQTLGSGFGLNADHQAIVVLRNYLMQVPAYGGSRQAYERYSKTARGLQAFLRGEPLSKLYMASTDPFPLPPRVQAATNSILGVVETEDNA